MSVFQLQDGRWVVQYRSKSDPQKKIREYFGRGVRGATTAQARQEALFGTGTRAQAVRGMPFAALAAAYLQAGVGRLAVSTQEKITYTLNRVVLPELGHVDVYHLTPAVMDLYVEKRLQSVKRTTVHRELSDILAILNWGVARGTIRTNPLEHYRKPERDDAVIAPPSAEEIAAIVSHAVPHLERAVILAYYTGLRPGASELFGIRWEDVNFADGLLLVRSAKKGGLKSRVVPLHPDLEKRLKKWRAEDRKASPPAEYIITYGGKPVRSVKRAFARAKEKAGVTRKLTLYSIRHAFATYLLGMSADLKTTSLIMGHTTPEITMRSYQHVNMPLARQTIDKLPRIRYKKPAQKTGPGPPVPQGVSKPEKTTKKNRGLS